MKIKVEIELDTSKLQKLEQEAKTAGYQAAQAIKTDVIHEQTAPMETGYLQSDQAFVTQEGNNKFLLVYDTPYARRVYFNPFPEFNFRTDKNRFANGLWLQPYIDGYKKDFFQENFRIIYRQRTKGLIK